MRLLNAVSMIAVLAIGTATPAQSPEVEITAEQVAPGIAVLFGNGGNIGLAYGEDGTVMIDDQFAPLTPKIVAAVEKLGATPVKYLINTHWHGDHTGGNENLGKAGAIIMAHDNVRIRLATPQQRPGGKIISPTAKIALPVITYHDGLSLHLNNDEVRTYFMPNGHTDGDSIVVWKTANVVHMGDLFFNKVTLPFIDLSSGGSAQGMLDAAEKVLTMTDANTKFIPGHGPMATRPDLIAYRDMLKSVIGSVAAGIKAKKTLAQIQATKPAAKWDTNPKGFITGSVFVDTVYRSLTANAPTKKHHH